MNLTLVFIGVITILLIVMVSVWKHVTSHSVQEPITITFNVFKGHTLSRFIVLPTSLPARLSPTLNNVADGIYSDLKLGWGLDVLGEEYVTMRTNVTNAVTGRKDIVEEFIYGHQKYIIAVSFKAGGELTDPLLRIR